MFDEQAIEDSATFSRAPHQQNSESRSFFISSQRQLGKKAKPPRDKHVQGKGRQSDREHSVV